MKRFLHTCSFVFGSYWRTLLLPKRNWVVPVQVEDLMANYCFDCHDEDTQKGDIRLDNLLDLNLPKRLDLLNRMQEQAFFKHMPPKKKKTQPSEEERKRLLDWMFGALGKHDASTLEGKLRKPEYGNYVDHDKCSPGSSRTCRDLLMTGAG